MRRMGKASSAKKIDARPASGCHRASGPAPQPRLPVMIGGILVVGLLLTVLAGNDRRPMWRWCPPSTTTGRWPTPPTSAATSSPPSPTVTEGRPGIDVHADGLIRVAPVDQGVQRRRERRLGSSWRRPTCRSPTTSITLPDGTTHTNGEGLRRPAPSRVALYVWPPQAGDKTEPAHHHQEHRLTPASPTTARPTCWPSPPVKADVKLPANVAALDRPRATPSRRSPEAHDAHHGPGRDHHHGRAGRPVDHDRRGLTRAGGHPGRRIRHPPPLPHPRPAQADAARGGCDHARAGGGQAGAPRRRRRGAVARLQARRVHLEPSPTAPAPGRSCTTRWSPSRSTPRGPSARRARRRHRRAASSPSTATC